MVMGTSSRVLGMLPILFMVIWAAHAQEIASEHSLDQVVPESILADGVVENGDAVTDVTGIEEDEEEAASTSALGNSSHNETVIPKLDPHELVKRLEDRFDPYDADQYANGTVKNNSLGLNRLIGDGRHGASKIGENGKVKSPGYTTEDAYTGPEGHYYIGAGRRRIGAGFGPRRRRTKSGEWEGHDGGDDEEEDSGELTDEQQQLQKECLANAKAEAEENSGNVLEELLTEVQGEVVDVGSAKGTGAQCTWKNAKTQAVVTVNTDKAGTYKQSFPRCEFFHVECEKEGFINGTGAGACSEPFILWAKSQYHSTGISEFLPQGEIRVVLTWTANDKYLKDLDLHLLIPGERDVMLSGYEKYLPYANMSMKDYSHNKSASSLNVREIRFNDTDLSRHADPLDQPNHIYWDNSGFKHWYPYATYELDYGSIFGVADVGGPEVIHIFKKQAKQYLVYIDCWSADEYEDRWGFDTDRPLTRKALYEFRKWSYATVRVFDGDRQTSCTSISQAKLRTTTRWDAVLLHGEQDGASGNVVMPHLGLNQFNQESPYVMDPTPSPTPAPPIEILPTPAPTHKCDGDHGCSVHEGGICIKDGNDWECGCEEGLQCVNHIGFGDCDNKHMPHNCQPVKA